MRKRTRSLIIPIALNVLLMGLVIGLMLFWIVSSAQRSSWTVLTLGTIAFSLVLIGLSFYLILTLKERQLNQRQINFVDSVTHELKSPIASLRLYLETLQLRQLDGDKRTEFYQTMDHELVRLDDMINQLLQVARLDAIGQESAAERIELAPLLERCAASTCNRHQLDLTEVFTFELQRVSVKASQIILEMIFQNLFDNAIKYGGRQPHVTVRLDQGQNRYATVDVIDNGEGVAPKLRKKIFRLFYRAGDELQRTQTGTGIGLYIVHTLVRILGGKTSVHNRSNAEGCVFQVKLPRRILN